MDRKDILQLRGKYIDAIDRLGSQRLTEQVTIEGLKFERPIIQQAYRDIQKHKLDMSFFDFLSYIATQYLVAEFKSYGDDWIDFAGLLNRHRNEAYCLFRAVYNGVDCIFKEELNEGIICIVSLEMVENHFSEFIKRYRELCIQRLIELQLAAMYRTNES